MDESLRRKAILIVITFVLLSATMTLFAGFYRRTARTRTMTIPFDVAACDEDSDCGIVNQIGCCPCESGGGQGAVNPHMRGLLKDFINHACRQRTPCIDVSACRTDLEPHCRDHECVLVGPADRAAREVS
jgi:hypothetical protein